MNLDGLAIPVTDEKFLHFKAYRHQIETFKELEKNRTVIINPSPTGSGKTLAWVKPVLEGKMNALVTYPINALVIDQTEAIKAVIEDHYDYHPDKVVKTATADVLENAIAQSEEPLTKGKLLKRWMPRRENKPRIILTNPDILNFALKSEYWEPGVAPSVRALDLLVFDEFHLANVKQREMILFFINEINKDNFSNLSQFLFLSATPETKVKKRIRELGLDLKYIEDQSVAKSKKGKNDKTIMPPVKLNIKTSSTFQTYEEILDDIDDYRNFIEDKRSLILVDGSHEVDELFNAFNDEELEVERISGFYSQEKQEKLQRLSDGDLDLIISNSSVEVGVDFDIDRMVFSGFTASKLIQRLGRIRNKKEVTEVICFVPEYVKKKLEKKSDNKIWTREKFENVIRDTYNSSLDIDQIYRETYAPLEAFLYIWDRCEKMTRDKRKQELERGITLINRHYGLNVDSENDIINLKEKADEIRAPHKGGIEEYRGGEPQLMVLDDTEDETKVKLYSLFYLLRWGKMEFLNPTEFKKYLSENKEYIFEQKKGYASGFGIFRGKVEEPRNVKMTGEGPIHYRKREIDVPKLIDNFGVSVAPSINSLGTLRNVINDEEFFCLITEGTPHQNQIYYGLDDYFFLYPYEGRRSVVFGHNALFLECIIKRDGK